MNSAGRREFAQIPPTVPATRRRTRALGVEPTVDAAWSRRSRPSRLAVRVREPFALETPHHADRPEPRCPAT
jgi:hypothetical protein